MPFPAVHQYMTVIGDAYGQTERWQFGMRLTDGGVSNEATALAISDDVQAWWVGSGTQGGNAYSPSLTHRLTELKVARIGLDGAYPDGENSYSHFYLPPLVGGGNKLAGASAQQTMVATLTTALPRGLASKGRVYLPPSARMATDAAGLIPVNDALEIANSIMNLIVDVNANALVGNVAIFSRGKGVPAYNAVKHRVEYTYPNPGAFNVVTGVRCGRVIDTQRRRRRSLVESPQVDDIP